MKAILINDLRRLWTQKQLVILILIFTAAASIAAIYVSTGMTRTWDVALISDSSFTAASPNINLIPMAETPLRSDLISGRYDAVLTVNEDGSLKLDTLKSDADAGLILAALEGSQETELLYSDRGTGTNILGFLMMFLLLMGSMAMSMYADDKEQGQIVRITASPVKISTYLAAHSLFNFCFLFFPAMILLGAIRLVSGVDMGYSFLQLTGMLALICAFSTAFCLLLYSLLSNQAESAKMTGNSIIILTSILAGGFYAFEKGNRALELLIKILPQKAYLTVAAGVEEHAAVSSYLPSFLYLVILILVFYTVSAAVTKKAYINKD